MKKHLLLTAVTTLTLSHLSHAATVVWDGSANDGNWSNASNWVGGAAPIDLTSADTIEFSGANMPTSNIAAYDGTLSNGALMVFKSGGTFGLDMSSSYQGGFISTTSRTIFTVGDGISGGTENVTLNISNATALLRHSSVTANYQVNADGALNFLSSLELYNDANKDATITIDGGAVSASGTLDAQFNSQAGSFIDFTAIGSSFSAQYGAGSAFTDFAAVQADASSVFKNNAGGILEFTDNGGNNFTVTAVPEPSSTALLGLGGLALLMRRRK